jgi:hypothetical protein
MDAGAGAEVDDVIGHADGVLVVFDDEHGVAEVAEADEGFEEAIVVALVEADAGFVEDVEDADQAGADLGSEADALGFAAAQGAAFAVERQVAEADLRRKPRRERISWSTSETMVCWVAGNSSVANWAAAWSMDSAQVSMMERPGMAGWGGAEALSVLPGADGDGEHGGTEAPSVAGVAVGGRHEALEPVAGELAFAFLEQALEVGMTPSKGVRLGWGFRL